MKECSEVKGEKPLHVCNMGNVVDLQCASYGPAVILSCIYFIWHN